MPPPSSSSPKTKNSRCCDFHWSEIVTDDLLGSHFLSFQVLYGFRIFAAVFNVGVLVMSFVYFWGNGTWFTFFTNLNYTLLCFYFGCHTFYPWFRSVLFSRILYVVAETEFTCALFLDGVFWTLLLPFIDTTDPAAMFLNVMMHLINFVFMFADVMFSRIRFYWSHLWITVVFIIVYTIFTFIYFLFSMHWVYPFLDPTKKLYAAILVGMFVYLFLCWTCGKLFVWLREKIASRGVFGNMHVPFDGHNVDYGDSPHDDPEAVPIVATRV
eukprot:ANDGO_03660.mRNA.1 hypothetical protein CAOG_05392